MRSCGRWANRAFRLCFALLALLVVGLGLLAARLSQGPLPLPMVAELLEATANQPDQPTRLAVGSVALAWEGSDADLPLDLRAFDLVLTDATGRRLAALPQASVSIALRPLLLGRLVPRTVALQGLDLRLLRSESGQVALDLGTQGERFDQPSGEAQPAAAEDTEGGGTVLAQLLADLTAPDGSPFGRHQLQRVVLRHARLAVVDAALGVTWSVPDLDLSLARAAGGLRLEGAATLMLGAEAVRLGLSGRWQAEGRGAEATVQLGAVRPAVLAAASPRLAPLALVDAAVSAELHVSLDQGLAPRAGSAVVRLGPGRLMPPGTIGIPIRNALLRLEATQQAARLTEGLVTLDTLAPGAAPVLAGTATLALGQAPTLSIQAGMKQFDVAELERMWPAGLARNARTWLVPNITAGQVTDLSVALQASVAPDFSALDPTSMAIEGRAAGATVHYLRPMPPAEEARGRFSVNLATADIVVDGARIGQRMQGHGTVRIVDLDTPVETADIALDMTSPLPDLLVLLQHPRLHLFDSRPLPPPVRDATGTANGRLSVRFPLLSSLEVEQVRIGVEGLLSDVRIPRLLAGQDVTDARLALSVTNESLKMSGPVSVVGTPASATYEQEFRQGPPSQVVERLRAEGRATPPLLAALGLETDGRLAGSPPTVVTMTTRRNGQVEAAIRADLRDSRVVLPEAGFDKPAGTPGTLEATVRLARERIAGIENLRAEMPGLSLRGRIGFTQGQPDRLVLSSLSLGRSQLSGEVQFGTDGAIAVTARGPVLDASPIFTTSAPLPAPPSEPPPPARPLRLDLGFEKVWLANERSAEGVVLRLDRHGGPRGGRIEQLSLSGRIGPEGAFDATVARRPAGRSLTARASDAGALLAAADVITSMAGGRMTIEGTFDDATEALSGTAEVADFRMRDAPGIARLLQAMTLYGLLDLARGPGLNFSQLTAPFAWQESVLSLSDARAFSPSLGLTVKGRIDTRAHALDLQGTVVPAYFFNSLLGNIPLIGRLFSPERGGGVFAATYSVRGPMNDPSVSVNPLAALTPGFLRGLFGIFDSSPAPPAAPAPQAVPVPAAPAPAVPAPAAPSSAAPSSAAPAPASAPAAPPVMAPISPPAHSGNSGLPPG